MASREEMEAYWDKRWERERQRGRNHYLLRNGLVQGVIPGILGGAILMFVQPRVGDENIGSLEWALVAFLVFSICGFLISWRWWRVGERRFLERRSKVDS